MPAQEDGPADCAGASGKRTISLGAAAPCSNYEFIVPDRISMWEISHSFFVVTSYNQAKIRVIEKKNFLNPILLSGQLHATLTIRAAARNPNYWGSRMQP